MNVFRYRAVTASGEIVEGELEAADKERAQNSLLEMGLVPIRTELAGAWSVSGLLSIELGNSGFPSRKEIMHATRELATLVSAGVELERALDILVNLTGGSRIARFFATVLSDVREGASLSDALDKHARRLPASYVSLIRAGEESGTLVLALTRLAAYLESVHTARENLRSALIYPMLLLVMAVVSVIIMVSVVLPQFEPLFASAGAELPALTRVMLAASDGIERFGPFVGLALIAAGFVFRQRLKNAAARPVWHRRFLKIPLVGTLLIDLDVARFARTMGTLLANGVATLPAFAIVRDSVSNAAFAQGLTVAAERVQSGSMVSDALSVVPRFPDLALHLIRIGEETGRLDDMLERTAAIYEANTQRTIQRLLTLLLPALTALIGLFIALVIASVFLAIVSVNQLAF